jgi:hypothetical protein
MSGVSTLAGEKYISLTTFKQDGTPVATPVWVVSDDGRPVARVDGAADLEGQAAAA